MAERKLVTELYAFIAVDPDDGNEGIMGFKTPDGDMMPMIGADLERVGSLTKIADEIHAEVGIEYEIRYFKLDENHSHNAPRET